MSARAVIRLAAIFGAMALTATAEERLDFQTRILPILTKAGCNKGNCHGAAVGQGGFKLSLLGYDPVQDHLNITRERSGRRISEALRCSANVRGRVVVPGDGAAVRA